MAFQGASGKDVAPFFAGAQFLVRVHLGVVDQASLLFLTFLSSTAFCVVDRIGALAFVGDPRNQGWEWLEEVINQDRSEKGVEVHQGVVHLVEVCGVAAHLEPAERWCIDCVSKFGGKGRRA